jgi:hypothetical protein
MYSPLACNEGGEGKCQKWWNLVERQVTYLVIGDNGPASHKGKKQDQHQRTVMLSKWWLSIHATFFL